MILRRDFLRELPANFVAFTAGFALADHVVQARARSAGESRWIDPATAREWHARWEKNILEDSDKTAIAKLNSEKSWVGL